MLVCAACGAQPPSSPSTTAASDTSARRRASYLVQPGELGDKDVLSRIHHHARIERVGMAWLVLGGTAVRDTPGEESLDPRPIVPVLGETKEHVRVVDESDGARVAVWILRSDLAPAIVEPAELIDERGQPIGVRLDPGVDIATPGGIQSVRPVAVRDDGVRIVGRVRAQAIGTVWIAPPPGEGVAFTRISLHAGAAVRSAPRADAPAIATLLVDLGAKRLAERGAWSEVEIAHAGIRIHGFVPARELSHELALDSVSGGHYGFSTWVTHTDSLEVPAGTCLYDRDGGDVVGVTIAAKTYSGYKSDEWDTVYIGSMFGSHTLRLHDTGEGSDLLPRWESCLE